MIRADALKEAQAAADALNAKYGGGWVAKAEHDGRGYTDEKTGEPRGWEPIVFASAEVARRAAEGT
jgi:hypothetical protein